MRYVCEDVPDTIYDSADEWGVPLLDLSMQAERVALPFVRWGSVHRGPVHMPGTWHFYIYDREFNVIWHRPFLLPLTGCACAVEPNVSTGPGWPRAKVLYGIYRKRWVARFWQSRGVRILVDLNVEREFWDMALLGVPDGWRAFSFRACAYEPEFSVGLYDLACRKAGTTDILMVVYGGGNAARRFCLERSLTWFLDERSVIRYGTRWS